MYFGLLKQFCRVSNGKKVLTICGSYCNQSAIHIRDPNMIKKLQLQFIKIVENTSIAPPYDLVINNEKNRLLYANEILIGHDRDEVLAISQKETYEILRTLSLEEKDVIQTIKHGARMYELKKQVTKDRREGIFHDLTKIAKTKYDYSYLMDDDDYTKKERIWADEYNDHLLGMSDSQHLFSYHLGKRFRTSSMHEHLLLVPSTPPKCHLD